MKDGTGKGYYRCNIKHQTFYEEFMKAVEKHITPSMMCMLQHDFSTQKKRISQPFCRHPRPKRQGLFEIGITQNKGYANILF